MAQSKPKKFKRNNYHHSEEPPLPLAFRIFTVAFVMIIFIFLILFFFSPTTLGFKDYLYYKADDMDTRPIIDYIVEGSDDQNDVRPKFITEEGRGPRIVEFYAPWCGHCVHFRPHYIDLARRVQGHPDGHNVKFYAISCTVHREVCNEYKISGYPSVFAIPAGKTDVGEVLNRRNMDSMRYILGKVFPGDNADAKESKESDDEKKISAKKSEEGNSEEESDKIVSFHTHSQSVIYSDASLSFNYALKNSIYMHTGPLSKEKTFVFRQWIDLLLKTLPTDEMQTAVDKLHKLRHDIKAATSGEDSMLELLKDVKEDDKATKEWGTCRKNDQFGYTCGLWSLFHIMTVGFDEYNSQTNADTGKAFDKDGNEQQLQMLKGKDKQITARAASKILRNYIENFFGCRECRYNFLKEYDDCRHDSCHLNDDRNNKMGKRGELALWLWAVHNGVNVRLLREEYEEEDKDRPSREEEERVMWPSRSMCGACWVKEEDGGGWDEEEVYHFLKRTYWPINNTIKQSLDRIDTPTKKKQKFPVISHMTPLYLIGMLAFLWYMVRKREKDAIGRLKKVDSSSVHDIDNLIL